MNKKKIYLDVCCLNRPFDDQSQVRIKIETDAILSLLHKCEFGDCELIGSEIIDYEISKIPDSVRREKVFLLASIANCNIEVGKVVEKRAYEISSLKFDSYDSLHIACAEASGADILLTTDDNILQKATRYKNIIKIEINNPITWLLKL